MFAPDAFVAAASMPGRWSPATRLAAPALLLGALALVPAGPAYAVPTFAETDISITANGAREVFSADLDGDGDVDVLSASYIDNKIAWYENDGAPVPGFTLHTISTTAAGARSAYAADLDGDGDVDVLSASYIDDKIAWYENDGMPDPGFTLHTISTTADSAFSVFAADLDGDGDVDVLSGSRDDDKIAWYENDGAPVPVSPCAPSAPRPIAHSGSMPPTWATTVMWTCSRRPSLTTPLPLTTTRPRF
ncbi:MAG: FG-GAP-like repeat-containing protein [Panacagrimonas sp.]